MIDMKNFGPAPRTQRDAFEKYLQADARREFRRERLIDMLGMAGSLIGALTCAVAIGLLIGWLG